MRGGFAGAVLCVCAGLVLVRAAAADEAPHRIVSANLCADRLILALADRDRIVSVSHFASDPVLSTVVEAARGIPPNHAGAEEIYALHPDLVVFGAYTQKASIEMLRGLGVRVAILPVPRDLDGVRAAIRDLATTLGVPERGTAMIAALDARFAALSGQVQLPSVASRRAVFYQAGGWSYGRNSLPDALLRLAGYRNLTADLGVNGFGALPLERLVAAAPDLVIVEGVGDRQPSIAASLLDHPALDSPGVRRLSIPFRLLDCADSALADAAALIGGATPGTTP